MRPGVVDAFEFSSGWPSQPEDDERGVVGDADGWDEIGQQGVGEDVGVGGTMPYEGVGEPAQADVDVLAAAFDEPVGVEDEGGAFGEDDLLLGTGGVFGPGAERGSVARSRKVTVPSGWQSRGGGWPALL